MEDGASRVAHLVELVDAADAVVSEHESAGLQHHLPSLGILGDIGSQPDGTGPLARCVLGPGIRNTAKFMKTAEKELQIFYNIYRW